MAESKWKESEGNGGSPRVREGNYLEREIRMVLVGKTGVGKSATGNTIVGYKAFTQSTSASSVTQLCKQHSFERDGYNLQLVDSPGFCDTKRSNEDIRKEVSRCVALSSPGLHAILFLVRIGRYTDEDQKTVDAFIQCFGEECRKYCLVIFTGGDTLDDDETTIDQFISTSPLPLQKFLSSVQDRYMVLNNKKDSPDKQTFPSKLVKSVLQMVQTNGGKWYTNDMYEKAEIELKKAEDEMLKKIHAANRARDEKLLQEKQAQHEEELKKQRLAEEAHARKLKEDFEREMQEIEAANRARNEKLLQEKQALHEEELKKQRLSDEEHARKMKEERERELKKIEEADRARNEKLLQEKQARHEEELKKQRLADEERARKMDEEHKREMQEIEDKNKQEARLLVRKNIEEDGGSILSVLSSIKDKVVGFIWGGM